MNRSSRYRNAAKTQGKGRPNPRSSGEGTDTKTEETRAHSIHSFEDDRDFGGIRDLSYSTPLRTSAQSLRAYVRPTTCIPHRRSDARRYDHWRDEVRRRARGETSRMTSKPRFRLSMPRWWLVGSQVYLTASSNWSED